MCVGENNRGNGKLDSPFTCPRVPGFIALLKLSVADNGLAGSEPEINVCAFDASSVGFWECDNGKELALRNELKCSTSLSESGEGRPVGSPRVPLLPELVDCAKKVEEEEGVKSFEKRPVGVAGDAKSGLVACFCR